MFVVVLKVDGLLVYTVHDGHLMRMMCARVTYVTCSWVAWAHVCPYHTCAILVGVMYIAWLICGGMCGSRRVCLCVCRMCVVGVAVGLAGGRGRCAFGFGLALLVGAWICICMAGDGARSL